MAYTYRRTGSSRSVGNRRTVKYYATTSGPAIAARSAAGARQDAMEVDLELTGGFETDATKITNAIDRRKGPVAGQKPAPPAQQAAPAPAPEPTNTPNPRKGKKAKKVHTRKKQSKAT